MSIVVLAALNNMAWNSAIVMMLVLLIGIPCPGTAAEGGGGAYIAENNAAWDSINGLIFDGLPSI